MLTEVSTPCYSGVSLPIACGPQLVAGPTRRLCVDNKDCPSLQAKVARLNEQLQQMRSLLR